MALCVCVERSRARRGKIRAEISRGSRNDLLNRAINSGRRGSRARIRAGKNESAISPLIRTNGAADPRNVSHEPSRVRNNKALYLPRRAVNFARLNLPRERASERSTWPRARARPEFARLFIIFRALRVNSCLKLAGNLFHTRDAEVFISGWIRGSSG